MEKHAFPILGDLRVDRIGREEVLRVLTLLWTSRPEQARKVRQSIRSTLSWAQAHGYVEVNVAGEADQMAPCPRMPAVKEHLRALPYQEVGAALETINASASTLSAKLAFRFTVLTADAVG